MAGGFLAVEFLKEKPKKGGIGEKSLMDVAKSQGEKIMSEKEWIEGCKESDPEARDDCYSMGAVYYRDTSLCEHIKDLLIQEECKKGVEKYYKGLEETGKEIEKLTPEEETYREYLEQLYEGGFPGALPDVPGEDEEGTREGVVGGGGGGATEEIYELSEKRQREMEEALKKVNDEVKVEITALMFYYMHFLSEEGAFSQKALKAMEKIDEIQENNNISDDVVSQIPIEAQEDPVLKERAEKRYNELVEKGLK